MKCIQNYPYMLIGQDLQILVFGQFHEMSESETIFNNFMSSLLQSSFEMFVRKGINVQMET